MIEALFFGLCVAATIFLLCFLLALSAEKTPSTGRVEHVAVKRNTDRACESTELVIAYSNPARQQQYVVPNTAGERFPSPVRAMTR